MFATKLPRSSWQGGVDPGGSIQGVRVASRQVRLISGTGHRAGHDAESYHCGKMPPRGIGDAPACGARRGPAASQPPELRINTGAQMSDPWLFIAFILTLALFMVAVPVRM